MRLSRRAFLKLAGATLAETPLLCACLGTGGCTSNPASGTPSAPAGSYHVQDGRLYITLAEVGALLGVGRAITFTLEDQQGSVQKVLLVRPAEADYRAFADACTHNGKALDYLHDEGLLACRGRSSRFSLTGQVIRGPAMAPLPCYRVWEERGDLVTKLLAETR